MDDFLQRQDMEILLDIESVSVSKQTERPFILKSNRSDFQHLPEKIQSLTRIQSSARVFDIRHDTPRSNDKFLVDTNVWFWLTYPIIHTTFSNRPSYYQIEHYPIYIEKIIDTDAQLFRCEFSFYELANIIEKSEWQIHEYSSKGLKSKSEYRKAKKHFREIESVSTPIELSLSEFSTNQVLETMKNVTLNSFDFLFVQAAKRENNVSLLTNDPDFIKIPGITIFTANQKLIEQARVEGKLFSR